MIEEWCDGMNLRRNKKGFTMVELLASIVVLGILSTIGIVTLVNLRKNQEIKFNENQKNMFIETAKTYFSDNKQYLPQKPLASEYVTLGELMESKYITEDFVDYKGNMYNKENSIVTVRRIGNGEVIYRYRGELVTGEGKKIETEQAKVDISFPLYSKKISNSRYQTLKLINGYDKYYSNSEPRIEFLATSLNKVNLAAYRYKIYRNGVLMYTSNPNYKESKSISDIAEEDIEELNKEDQNENLNLDNLE